ncbi:GNAT family N-acetyltransferase [uncultured Vagococcus sp.]|uniref:GNAT family N-acetyltransferase n=1 Tax=uncultured Vagococcus sp. TaxID=189676 RepID=UPI0028D29BE0|nr:GNAT family N-acetyltransferase [uncultured Vagococcus sp.]
MEYVSFNQVPIKEAVALWNQSFSDYLIPIDLSEEALVNRLSELQLSPVHSLIAKLEGQQAGIMLYGHHLINGEETAWIGGMGVHPDYRRNGVAKRLIQEAIRTSKDLGVSRLLLEVIKGNDRAEALYRQLGFQEVNQVSYNKGMLNKDRQNKVALQLEEESVTNERWSKQLSGTTWQNMFISNGDLWKLIVEQEEVGYLYCSELKLNDKLIGLVIKQLVLYPGHENLVEAVLSSLFSKYGEISVSASNFDLNWPVTRELKRLGLNEELRQIQMELLIK